MLGSSAKEDQCRVCGGDNSTCNSVEGVYDSNDLQTGKLVFDLYVLAFPEVIKLFNSLWVTGYNDVLLIPVGATNIVIREVKPSNNYLGNRKLDLIRHSLWCP